MNNRVKRVSVELERHSAEMESTQKATEDLDRGRHIRMMGQRVFSALT